MTLPDRYAWLAREPGPLMLLEALKLYSTLETPGPESNPTIVAWADEIGDRRATAYNRWAARWYDSDGTPWCGLLMGVVALRASQGREERFPPDRYLAAQAWAAWGDPVGLGDAMLGDVLVFGRKGGGHVALYVGEDEAAFHILGGNQGDAVSIIRKLKTDLIAVRRPVYRQRPANVRKIRLDPVGSLAATLA